MIAQKARTKAAGDTPKIDAGFTRKRPEHQHVSQKHIHGANTFFFQPLSIEYLQNKTQTENIKKFVNWCAGFAVQLCGA